jgi:tetratricopeptide (TPR) repeat protein
MKRHVVALTLVVLATSARADVWQHAVATGSPDVIKEIYERQMQEGDEQAEEASSRSSSRVMVAHHIDLAVASYRTAATTRPTAAEPYFRIGTVLDRFYANCSIRDDARPPTCIPGWERMLATDIGKATLEKVSQAVDAWDAFEARAPLDPRVNQLLVDRAIRRTQLITANTGSKKLLEAAARDYEAAINRRDGLSLSPEYEIWGNLAETYMMLGRLDDSVAAYKQAIRGGAPISMIYGLAVAFDRDERGLSARDLIVDQGVKSFEAYSKEFNDNAIFYVPAGEEHYYFALVEEALGMEYDAADRWRKYIASGAHPEFQPRARAHLDALQHKLTRAAPPPTPSELER